MTRAPQKVYKRTDELLVYVDTGRKRWKKF